MGLKIQVQRRSGRILLVAMLAALGACTGTADLVDTTLPTDIRATSTTDSLDTTQPNDASTTVTIDIPEIVDVTDWIAYQGAGITSSEAVILIHPDGSGKHEIDDDIDGFGQLPDWSPDGTKVVMTPRGPAPETLYEYDLATESTTILFDCVDPCIGDDEPAYSPDGTQVLFVRASLPFVNDAPSDCGLWIGHLDTREVEQITSNEGCDREYNPRWSPDGTRIAYARERVDGSGTSDAIFVIDANGGEETQLTEWDLVAGYPDWSPDGEWIVFVTYPFFSFNDDGPTSNLYRMRPDGTGTEQLTFYETPSPRPNQPRYTPEGQWIVFTMDTGASREIWLMASDGGEPVALITGGIHTHPAWQPTD